MLNYQKQSLTARKGAAAGANMAQLEWVQKLMMSRSVRDQLSVSGHVENGWLTVSKAAD